MKLALPLLVFLLSAAACTPATLQYPSRSVSREAFFSQVRTVAYAPVLSSDSPGSREFANKVGSFTAAALAPRGLRLMSDAAWQTCWKSGVASMGGLYRSDNGRLDEAKEAKLRWRCHQQVVSELNVDAVLETEVLLVHAPMESDVVRWHGVEEDVASFGERFWSGTYSGTLPALSLHVRITDRQGKVLYDSAGGIEVAATRDGNNLVDKPALLKDNAKLREAVRVALARLFAEE